jgi:hypothetical protein
MKRHIMGSHGAFHAVKQAGETVRTHTLLVPGLAMGIGALPFPACLQGVYIFSFMCTSNETLQTRKQHSTRKAYIAEVGPHTGHPSWAIYHYDSSYLWFCSALQGRCGMPWQKVDGVYPVVEGQTDTMLWIAMKYSGFIKFNTACFMLRSSLAIFRH